MYKQAQSSWILITLAINFLLQCTRLFKKFQPLHTIDQLNQYEIRNIEKENTFFFESTFYFLNIFYLKL